MLARIRRSVQEEDQGFTLIELLVVMVIIGVLSAIAIPTFLNQRNKAYDAAAKADVANMGREIATYYVDNTTPLGAFTFTAPASNENGRWAFTGGPSGTITNGLSGVVATRSSAADWCVAATSQSTQVWSYSVNGPKRGAC